MEVLHEALTPGAKVQSASIVSSSRAYHKPCSSQILVTQVWLAITDKKGESWTCGAHFARSLVRTRPQLSPSTSLQVPGLLGLCKSSSGSAGLAAGQTVRDGISPKLGRDATRKYAAEPDFLGFLLPGRLKKRVKRTSCKTTEIMASVLLQVGFQLQLLRLLIMGQVADVVALCPHWLGPGSSVTLACE